MEDFYIQSIEEALSALGYDIVIMALPRWDSKYSSTAFSLAKALARHTRVFYVDNPYTYKDYARQRHSEPIARRKQALLYGKQPVTQPLRDHPNFYAVTPRLIMPINWLPPGWLYERLSKVNDAIVYKALEQMLNTFQVKNFVFINFFNPLFGKYFPNGFKPALSVYYSVDDISQSDYISKHGVAREREAVSDAGLTLVTSTELQRLNARAAKRIMLLPNAADVGNFLQTQTRVFDKPNELRFIAPGTKIILYMGNICHRLDYALLVSVAKGHPDKVLVMIGPLAFQRYKEFGLDKLPNVIFTGSKQLTELPAYLQHAHVCLIPFLRNQLTRSIYPLKINEYLASGKPVVTTGFSEDINNFKDVVYIGDSENEFMALITKAIDEDTEQKRLARIAVAEGNNWDQRAQTLVSTLHTEFALA
ncbi:MAG: glycosyltransferase family 1 protein [Bacteroidia bacterium]|nr:glycosyltransferase family 1 protein [Bacteroidia bacterium]